MEQIFETLKGILVRAIPTFFLVIALHWFLKKVLFEPMERVLAERRAKTQGAVEASEAALARVNEKMADYEARLTNARAEIFLQQEESRKHLAAQQASLVEAARVEQAGKTAQLKRGLADEVQQARMELAAEADRLAEQIAGALLAGKVH